MTLDGQISKKISLHLAMSNNIEWWRMSKCCIIPPFSDLYQQHFAYVFNDHVSVEQFQTFNIHQKVQHILIQHSIARRQDTNDRRRTMQLLFDKCMIVRENYRYTRLTNWVLYRNIDFLHWVWDHQTYSEPNEDRWKQLKEDLIVLSYIAD